MNIPFNHFQRHFKSIETEVEVAVSKVLKSGWYILGNEVNAFEENFARYTGSKHCISVANGTEAIALALMALGIGKGDEVITTSLTAYPTVTAIKMTGAVPVAADVQANCLIDVKSVRSLITQKTKAIIPVHLYGQICDIDELKAVSNEYSISIVEDCAQSAGARINSVHCGNFGTIGCFSFYPTKNLGAFGDAGAVTTNDDYLGEKLKSLRNYGQTDRYKHDFVGINSRMDEMQAAILNVKLKYLDKWNLRRKEIADKYSSGLPDSIQLQRVGQGDVFHLYPVLIEKREKFMEGLRECGVTTIIHYPYPVFTQEAYKGKHGKCVKSKQFCGQLVSLPINPEMTNEEVDYIISVTLRALK